MGRKYVDPALQCPEAARQRAIELAALNEAKTSKLRLNKDGDDFKKGFAEVWAECFKKNESLIHVDLSNNNVEGTDVEIIAEGLKSNHTILGMHFNGNAGYIDN